MFDFDTPVSHTLHPTARDQNKPTIIKTADMPSFSASEADFHFAPVIADALQELSREGIYQCHNADCTFIRHLCWWIQNGRHSSISPEWIVPSFGTIYSVNFFMTHFLSIKDKIVILSPCFHKYKSCAEKNHRTIIEVPLLLENNHYFIDFVQLEKVFSQSDTKMFILCNPHNPIGQIWDEHDVRHIAMLAAQYSILIFSDEIFADNVYGGRHVPPIWELYPEKSVSVISLHKSFCLTGSCQSNLIIPNEKLRHKAVHIRDMQYFGYIEAFAYYAVIHAYTPEGLSWLHEMNDYVEKNISYIRSYCADHLPSINVIGGEGAFILWLDFRTLFGTDEQQLMAFCENEALFDILPGSLFGNDGKGFVRMCVASPHSYIKKGMGSLSRAIHMFNPDFCR
jgi:cystathionine beta-lyase